MQLSPPPHWSYWSLGVTDCIGKPSSASHGLCEVSEPGCLSATDGGIKEAQPASLDGQLNLLWAARLRECARGQREAAHRSNTFAANTHDTIGTVKQMLEVKQRIAINTNFVKPITGLIRSPTVIHVYVLVRLCGRDCSAKGEIVLPQGKQEELGVARGNAESVVGCQGLNGGHSPGMTGMRFRKEPNGSVAANGFSLKHRAADLPGENEVGLSSSLQEAHSSHINIKMGVALLCPISLLTEGGGEHSGVATAPSDAGVNTWIASLGKRRHKEERFNANFSERPNGARKLRDP
ncbi:hypothetical protein EYF80_030253 [Liparis tanakae]|uniref:Uncharacterized protein n=1 Tax=Liparis tanakae TaxID=230148 RepID=A0A4Z2H190_9TELE|nr:hypothetical protein EYF80_030253 [Liparis tanakae]